MEKKIKNMVMNPDCALKILGTTFPPAIHQDQESLLVRMLPVLLGFFLMESPKSFAGFPSTLYVGWEAEAMPSSSRPFHKDSQQGSNQTLRLQIHSTLATLSVGCVHIHVYVCLRVSKHDMDVDMQQFWIFLRDRRC